MIAASPGSGCWAGGHGRLAGPASAGSALLTNYTLGYGSSQIAYSSTVNGLGLQFFRLELARTTTQGPRVIELDGFSTVRLIPEPASVVLTPAWASERSAC
ncbi:MAG: hypothetical protein U0800_27565 [Isosphaeraceae bacterium]